MLLGGDGNGTVQETLSQPTIPPTAVVVAPTLPPQPTLPPEPVATPVPPEPATHTVQSGESLSLIANQYNTTVDTLVELNDLASPDQLEVGQVLVLPAEAE